MAVFVIAGFMWVAIRFLMCFFSAVFPSFSVYRYTYIQTDTIYYPAQVSVQGWKNSSLWSVFLHLCPKMSTVFLLLPGMPDRTDVSFRFR